MHLTRISHPLAYNDMYAGSEKAPEVLAEGGSTVVRGVRSNQSNPPGYGHASQQMLNNTPHVPQVMIKLLLKCIH